MIEGFDKDYELAIDKELALKQYKMVMDSLKRSGVGLKLQPVIEEISCDDLERVIDMIKVGNKYEKISSDKVAAAFKTIMKRMKEV